VKVKNDLEIVPGGNGVKGISNQKVLPLLTLLSTPIFPLREVTKVLQIDKPSPEP